MEKETVMRRVRALLSKTIENGCTESEAFAALAKAQEMMAEHGLTLSDVDAEKFISKVAASVNATGIDWKRDLAMGVATLTGTYCYIDTGTKKIIFAGRESGALFADWLVQVLSSFVNRAALNYVAAQPLAARQSYRATASNDLFGRSTSVVRQDVRMRGAAIHSFGVGCVDRINARLQELCTRETLEAHKAAKRKLECDGMSFGRAKSTTRAIGDAAAMRAGMQAGDAATFNRPVNQGATVHQIGRA